MSEVRVRFAPSPTGPLHLGGMRTALYDYLYAKHTGGKFIVRIEDTDTARFVPGAEQYIMDALHWAGIDPDESPMHGGPYGPYRQSERREIYDRYKDQILRSGHAYLAFDTPEELEAVRAEYEARGEVFSYNYLTRTQLKNSLSMAPEVVQTLLNSGTPYVIRFKMPVDRILPLEDIIRGKFSVNTNTLDDKVLVKNDGMPTYHFANIIDDHEMKISHVIRGEEWLPSLGLHILLYEAMGWQPPVFAHLSLILKPEGKGKLSKRDGAKFGFPVFPLDYKDAETAEIWPGYREKGYLPEAFVNFLALLGWTPAGDQEILSLHEMAQLFDINKLHKAGARFSKEKAEWFNQQYIQRLTVEEACSRFRLALPMVEVEQGRLEKIVALMKDRCTFITDIFDEGKFFFRAPEEYDAKAKKKAWGDDIAFMMQDLQSRMNAWEFDKVSITTHLKNFAEFNNVGVGKILMPLRLALVGDLKGPDVPDIMLVLGKEETISRINRALEKLK